MPFFYFHLHVVDDVADQEGLEFADLRMARDFAERQTREFIGDAVKETGTINLRHFLDIEDENGKVLDRVSFADVVTVAT